MGKGKGRRVFVPSRPAKTDFAVPALPEIQDAIVSKICPETGQPHAFNFHDGVCDCGAYDPFVQLESPADDAARITELLHQFVDDVLDQGVDLHRIRRAIESVDVTLQGLEDQQRRVTHAEIEKNQIRGS